MRFRKRPIGVTAMHLLINNAEEVAEWSKGDLEYDSNGIPSITLSTDHGPRIAQAGDWIVLGPKNDYYPVEESDFYVYFERVEEF